MGIVIHFEGQLKSEENFSLVIHKAKELAAKYEFKLEPIAENKQLSIVRGEEEWTYDGPVKGIKILLAELAEPVWLEFDENFYLQDFCKTQFADISTHIILIEFLRGIAPYFEELDVFDEGQFWETGDIKLLEQQREAFFEALSQAQQENPALQVGPFKTQEGRIIDAIG